MQFLTLIRYTPFQPSQHIIQGIKYPSIPTHHFRMIVDQLLDKNVINLQNQIYMWLSHQNQQIIKLSTLPPMSPNPNPMQIQSHQISRMYIQLSKYNSKSDNSSHNHLTIIKSDIHTDNRLFNLRTLNIKLQSLIQIIWTLQKAYV